MNQRLLIMPTRLSLVFLLLISMLVSSFCLQQKKARVLVFSKTAAYKHKSIPNGIAAIKKIGEEQGFVVDTTTDSTQFREDVLKKYKAIIFLNTSGNILGSSEEKAFKDFVNEGGGFVGIHSATDTEYEWEWYGKFIGAYFDKHPKVQQAKLKIVDASHSSTKGLPSEWIRTDEWYNFKNMNKDNKVLITVDESSYTGGKHGDHHPIAWWNEHEGGRVFYTALGHTAESYKEPLFLEHLKGGILFAIGR